MQMKGVRRPRAIRSTVEGQSGSDLVGPRILLVALANYGFAGVARI
jgi:hypothetical protein